jgi:hypothetical protein
MTRHHRELRLPAFPRPYPVTREQRSSRPAEPERLRPLLWTLLLLQGLTLLLLVAGPSPQRPLPSTSQPGLAALLDTQTIHSPLTR